MAVLNELSFRLSRRRSSVPRARAVLLAALADWSAGQVLVEDAELVLSELLTNALAVRVPRDRLVGVRIVHSEMNGVLRIEVSDAGGGRPEVRLPTESETGGRGLMLVDALAYRWGFQSRSADIGKTVWAELKAPDLPPPAVGREVAAVTVRPGQQVRVWGSWQQVSSVRTEPFPSGDLAIVIGLDEGSAMRLPACEPLTVRDA
jgi:anti-sigma regulatory factor (Ser/Thr protein kinase)